MNDMGLNSCCVGTGQGTLMLVRSDVKHHLIQLPPLQAMEATAIKIFIDQKPLLLVGPYLSPSKRIVTADLDAIARLGGNIFMAGDFNSKHPYFCSIHTNKNGRLLYDYISTSRWQVLSQFNPTHYPHNVRHTPDVLDYALYRNISYFMTVEARKMFHSNHILS